MSNATFSQVFGPYIADAASLTDVQGAVVDQIELHRGSGWLHARLLLGRFTPFETVEQAERAVAKGLSSPPLHGGKRHVSGRRVRY